MTKPDDMQPPTTPPDNIGEAMGAGMMAEAHHDMDPMGDSGQPAETMSEPHADAAMTEEAHPDHKTGDRPD